MERTLSPDEKIRRAEEIYYRRMQNKSIKSTRVNVSENKRDFVLIKKMILQIIICMLIYTIFYIIQNTNYIFSEDIIKKANEALSYDINIQKMYEQGVKYFNEIVNKVDTNTVLDRIDEDKTKINLDVINQIKNDSLIAIESGNKTEEQSGDSESEIEEKVKEESLTQMEQDSKYILENIHMEIPLNGIITSRFGIRNSENPNVPKNHTGIDIAANQGTVFISAMSGTVEKVSSEGDLGNHLKITNGDISTIYAHCKTIYVKQGEQINQGQQIGEVGSTGNSTGPHLHFAIKRGERYVNPDLIMKFE